MKKKFLSVFLVITICFSLLFSMTSCKENKDSNYYAEIVFNEENMTIDGKITVDFYNPYDFEIEALSFYLYGNAYRKNAKYSPVSVEKTYEAYGSNKDIGYIDIEKCYISGEEASFDIKGSDLNILEIKLDSFLKQGERIQAEIVFTEKIAKVKHNIGYTENYINLCNFLPVLCVYENGNPIECQYYSNGNPFYSNADNFKVSIKVPSEYTIASSGECINAQIGGNFTTYTFEAENARDFGCCLSKNFNVISGKINDVTLNYYYIEDQSPSNSFEIAANALRAFDTMFSKYPYKTLNIAETTILSNYFDCTSICLINSSLSSDERNDAIISAIASQWWKEIVGTNGIENSFITDGLSIYSTALFFKNNDKYGISKEDYIAKLERRYNTFIDIYKLTNKTPNTVVKRDLSTYSNSYEYYSINKCLMPIILDEVSKLCGEEDFLNTLKYIANDYAFQNISYVDFIDAFKTNCNVDVSMILDAYLNGKVK